MSTAVQRWLYTIIFSILALWPALHTTLAHTMQLHPWKLLSFAMYTVPHTTDVAIADATNGMSYIDTSILSTTTTEAIQTFVRKRNVLGAFIAPTHMATLLFEDVPTMQVLQVEIDTNRIDRNGLKTTHQSVVTIRRSL